MALDLRPLTLAELLDRSFSTYRRHVWLFAGIMAVPAGFALVYAILMQFVQYWTGPMAPNLTPEQAMWTVLPTIAAGLIFLVVYMVVYAFALGATTVAVARIYNDQPVDVAATYRAVRPQGWRLVGLFLWASLRVGLVWIGLFALAGALSVVSGILSPILAFLLMFVGMVLASVASVYFAVRYGVCVPAAVLENLSPNRAIKRSVQLTQGHRGRIFLILLCAVVITYATVLLLQGPFMVGAMIVGPETTTALTLNIIGAVLGTAGSTFSGPIMIIGLAMAYYDLRIRKEALDLQMMLASLDAPSA
jgi:Membrane domain of glycerophosphoryl diester phosphodiesterase